MKIDVCLVHMPFGGVTRPSLALGLLQAVLGRRQINTQSVYANLFFAEKVGFKQYSLPEITAGEDSFGDWLFRTAAFPDFAGNDTEYLTDLRERNRLLRQYDLKSWLQLALELRVKAERFVEEIVAQILNSGPKIVGCSSTFQQHVASLALLRRIRDYSPDVTTMLGGANCETLMGKTTHESFPWVDFVVSGEADAFMAELCTRLLAGDEKITTAELPFGVYAPVHRLTGYPDDKDIHNFRATTPALDELPAPDYDDYFATLKKLPQLSTEVKPGLVIEASRGCWWGEKQGCTFCGLNGAGKCYRRKESAKILAELDFLSSRHQISHFETADNVLDLRLFKTLLPVLRREKKYSLFFEVRAGLPKESVQMLAESGVHWTQPGIESLHSKALALMHKGCKAYQNIQMLKWSRLFGIRVSWNLLYDFPGEKDDWYQEMADLIPQIVHLQPPSGMIKLRFDRYSSFQQNPEQFGLKLVPFTSSSQVYPLSYEQISDLVYYFRAEDRDESGGFSVLNVILDQLGRQKLKKEIRCWKSQFWRSAVPPVLQMIEREQEIYLVDTRNSDTESERLLTPLEVAMLGACDVAITEGQLTLKMIELGFDRTEIKSQLENLLSTGTVLFIDSLYLSLVLETAPADLLLPEQFPGGHWNYSE